MPEAISRRHFIKNGCLGAAAVAVTLGGGGAAYAMIDRPKIDMPSSTFGDKSIKPKILIAYATKAGSTAEIAARIGETIARRGHAVDVKPINQVPDLNAYHTVIIGSAIRMGKILPSVLTFIKNNQSTLQRKNFNIFIGCLTLHEDTPANRAEVSAYLDPVRAIIPPKSEGLFAGVMDPARLGLVDRLIIQAMKLPVGDFRKWDQIQAWAEAMPVS